MSRERNLGTSMVGTALDLLADHHGASTRPPAPIRSRPEPPPPHVARQIRRFWLPAMALLPLTFFEVAMDATLTLSYRYLIDKAIVPHDARALTLTLGTLAATLVVSAIASTWRDYRASRLVARVVGDVRRRVFEHVQSMSTAFHATHGSADLLSRFSVDIAALEQSLAGFAAGIILPAFGVLVGVGLLFTVLDWPVALFATLIWPLVLLGPRLLAPRAAAAAELKKEADAELFAHFQQALDGHRVVKVFDLFAHLRTRFVGALRTAARRSARASFLYALVERSTVVPVYTVQVMAVSLGAILAFRGSMSVGLLVAFLTVFWNLGWSIVVLSRAAPMLVLASASMRRLDELLDEPTDLVEATGGSQLATVQEGIALDNVTFRYDNGTVALFSVSLKVTAGDYIALVGPSGSGKSTILSLLSRFHDPQGGSIKLDGKDIKDIDIHSLRAQTAVVMQDSFLFDASLRENIRMGRPEATDAEVETAAREADIHDMISALSSGYETRVGSGGQQLSGGQRQRIAIARALVRRPSLMLLDEASSALDPATESTVNATLARACKGRTTVSVTHRLISAVHATKIVVLKAGRIFEVGTHEQLLARRGVYAELWNKQNGFDVTADGGAASVSVERLRGIPLLAPLPEPQLEKLTQLFVAERAAAGQAIFHQGEPGSLFYLIVRGTVSVSIRVPTSDPNAPSESREVARLEDGDPFGEMALLHDGKRNATITAATDCVFLTLTRDRFTALLAETPAVRVAVEKAAQVRVAALAGTKLSSTLH